MNAFFENFKFAHTSNISEKIGNFQLKDYYLYQNISDNLNSNKNNINNKLIINEAINKLALDLKNLNNKYLKEYQNIIINNKNIIINSNMKNSQDKCKIADIQKSNEINNKNAVDSFSEIKKFKTELCHSWEITGTCKYGLNVIYILYNIYFYYFNKQCVFAHGIQDLRNPLKEEKKSSYKTKLCKQFFCDGYCPYGKRCQFSHQKKNISYINILKQIIKHKKITKKNAKIPRLDVFKNLSKMN